MPNPEINTFWFNICISFPCWWKKQVSQVVVSGQNRVLQGIWSKGTSLWRLDWWTKVLLSLSDHALSKTHTLGLLLWLVWGLHLPKLLICRMVMPSIKNGPHTNTKGARLPCLQQKQLAIPRGHQRMDFAAKIVFLFSANNINQYNSINNIVTTRLA